LKILINCSLDLTGQRKKKKKKEKSEGKEEKDRGNVIDGI